MNRFDFTITISQFIEDLDAVEAFYARLDDVSLFNADGVTRITFHREAANPARQPGQTQQTAPAFAMGIRLKTSVFSSKLVGLEESTHPCGLS